MKVSKDNNVTIVIITFTTIVSFGNVLTIVIIIITKQLLQLLFLLPLLLPRPLDYSGWLGGRTGVIVIFLYVPVYFTINALLLFTINVISIDARSIQAMEILLLLTTEVTAIVEGVFRSLPIVYYDALNNILH